MLSKRRFFACMLVTVLVGSGGAARAGPPSAPSDSEPDPEDRPADSPRPSAGPGVTAPAAGSAGPRSGVHHPLERGTTLGMVARTYGVPIDTLMAANRIVDPTSIPAGALIFVPGATGLLPVKPPAAAGSRFAWPLRGRLTSPFGSTKKRARHSGIDIDGEAGEPIHAAADGRVVRIADNARYGLLVVIEHRGGYATWYGHASDLLVGKGDAVTRGQEIALVGKTGNAHGSHLHFEIRRNGSPVDPLPLLEGSRTSR